jgi:SAM-dependent methyltransferase
MPDPIFPGRIGLYASMLHYGLTGYRDFAREHAAFYQQLRADEGSMNGLQVLDVGCGKSYWLSLLLAADGARAVGVDTEQVENRRDLAKYRHIMRANGLERTLRTAAWDVLFAKGYYRELTRAVGCSLPHELVQLHVYDGVHLPLPDASVDLAVSHEVFEHIADVPAVLSELARVLRPDGRIYIYIHSFTSLSGGHHIAWKHPDTRPSRVVAPWDHLRQRKHANIPSWLNGLREHEYRAMFEKAFEIDEWRVIAEEGRALLTNDIRKELSHYSERELLSKGFLIRGRLRKS